MIKNKTSLRGFTLLELIVVIAIIGVLSVIIIPSFTTALARSRDGRKVSEMSGLQKNLLQFAQNNNGLYPGGSTASATMPTQAQGCSTASTTVGLCAIIASGIDTRLPAGAYMGSLSVSSSTYNYAGVACYSSTGLCQSYQLWTDLEQSNVALNSDYDATRTSTSTFGTSIFNASGLLSPAIPVAAPSPVANGASETCNGTFGSCVFDIVP